tara:strand:+ start:292 stop:504 length:213 start_codon:yes stop_codon:yes gene_type:complete
MKTQELENAVFQALQKYNELNKFYTVAEAAAHHRVSSRTIRNWIHQDKIKATSPSIGVYRIAAKDLNNIL